MDNISKRHSRPTGRRLNYNELLAENKMLKAAVQFYAHPENWHMPNMHGAVARNVMDKKDLDPLAFEKGEQPTAGHRARNALRQIK